jgi:hypothetical protein
MQLLQKKFRTRRGNPVGRGDEAMEHIMTRTNYLKGMVGGLAGTIALSTFMVMKDMMGIMPQFDMVGMLATMLGGSRTAAWIMHFLIGTVVWGALFAWLDPYLPGGQHWLRGTWFGIGAWALMMILVMPMTGAGLFAANLGMMVTAATLMLHAMYGAVLGSVYAVERPDPVHQLPA